MIRRGRGRPRKYRFGDLNVGDHFDVKLRSHGHRISIAASAHAYSVKYGGRFETRQIRIDQHGLDRSYRPTTDTATHVRVTRIA